MRRRFCIALAVAITSAIYTPATAQSRFETVADGIRACRTLKDNLQRLKCFDNLFAEKLDQLQPSTSSIKHGLSFGPEKRLELLPVLFVPSDNNEITPEAVRKISDLLYAHLELMQSRYLELLKTDTFKIADGALNVYRSKKPHSYYIPSTYGEAEQAWEKLHPEEHDRSLRVLKELFEWKHDNRYDSKYIYLTIYARPGPPVDLGKNPQFGNAAPHNGLPNSGGGHVILELSSLLSDVPYTFQAALSHESGHAFGLAHVDCYGQNMRTNQSFMAYNSKFITKGLEASRSIFNPEDYFVLSQNKRAFPNFQYVEAIHNPHRIKLERIQTCYLEPRSSYIGAMKRIPGVGYELRFDGKIMSGGETVFWSFVEAKGHCRGNIINHPDIRVECWYDGKKFDPGPKPKIPNLAGPWCEKIIDGPNSSETPVSIEQHGMNLTFRTPSSTFSGVFFSNDLEVFNHVNSPVGGDYKLPAAISSDGNRLDFSGEGRVWFRKPRCER